MWHGTGHAAGDAVEAALEIFDPEVERLVRQAREERLVDLDVAAPRLRQASDLHVERPGQIGAPGTVVGIEDVGGRVRDRERSGHGDLDGPVRRRLRDLPIAHQERFARRDFAREGGHLGRPGTVAHGALG